MKLLMSSTKSSSAKQIHLKAISTKDPASRWGSYVTAAGLIITPTAALASSRAAAGGAATIASTSTSSSQRPSSSSSTGSTASPSSAARPIRAPSSPSARLRLRSSSNASFSSIPTFTPLSPYPTAPPPSYAAATTTATDRPEPAAPPSPPPHQRPPPMHASSAPSSPQAATFSAARAEPEHRREGTLARSNTDGDATSVGGGVEKPRDDDSGGGRGVTDQILLSRQHLSSAGSRHPRVAVLLGVPPRWHWPLHVCRALSCLPAAWWGLRCALTFLHELLMQGPPASSVVPDGGSKAVLGAGVGAVAAAGGWGLSVGWEEAERRFRVTEVFLAILWCASSAYLSFFFTDCLMTRWLLNYTPIGTLIRLLTLNAIIAEISSLGMSLSGASQDPRMLLPAWVSIATLLTAIYHVTQRKINIRKETHASIHVFSFASFVSLCAILFQLHLVRDNDPVVPLFEHAKRAWAWLKQLQIGD